MTSLYGRLQRDQRSVSKEPLEDFSTEALADLLNRMPRAEMAALAAEWFVAPGASRDEWLAWNEAATSVVWSTQVWINDFAHRLDLLVRADGWPVLVFEVTIWVGLQQHRAGMGEGDELRQPMRTQLHT